LLEHAMKVVERIFEHRIWQQIEVDDMQFGFMKSKGITDAIFTVRQMQENFRVKGKKLYFRLVDLEKAFDRVPREVKRWAMPKKNGWYRQSCLCIQVQKQLLKQCMVIRDVKLVFSCNRSLIVQNRILTEARSIPVDAHHAMSTESAT